jgi:hypothetical protein
MHKTFGAATSTASSDNIATTTTDAADGTDRNTKYIQALFKVRVKLVILWLADVFIYLKYIVIEEISKSGVGTSHVQNCNNPSGNYYTCHTGLCTGTPCDYLYLYPRIYRFQADPFSQTDVKSILSYSVLDMLVALTHNDQKEVREV